MQLSYLKEMLKLNRKDSEISEEVLEDVKKYSNLTTNKLIYTMVVLMDGLTNRIINKEKENDELKNKISILESDIKTLKENSSASEKDLAIGRIKNKAKINDIPCASKETIDTLKANGMKGKEICEKLGVSRSTLWRKCKQ